MRLVGVTGDLAFIDLGHLLIRARSADGSDDISFQIFAEASGHNFPLCGMQFIAHTWHYNPACGISILSDEPLQCASDIVDGTMISDLAVMRSLFAVWQEGAERIRLQRLPLGMQIYQNWDTFDQLLGTAVRDDEDTEDLRILTIAFTSGGAPEDKLTELAKKGLRVKILLTDPVDGEHIVRARNKIRMQYDDETPESALKAILDQGKRLQDRKKQIDKLAQSGGAGELKFAFSDLMPYAFLAHLKMFVVLGLFLATGSYGAGPMIAIDALANKSLCDSLRAEWQARWNEAELKNRHPSFAALEHSAEREYLAGQLLTDGESIWIASNVGDETSKFSGTVRRAVQENAKRALSRMAHLKSCLPHVQSNYGSTKYLSRDSWRSRCYILTSLHSTRRERTLKCSCNCLCQPRKEVGRG